jgi:hypothetical protein
MVTDNVDVSTVKAHVTYPTMYVVNQTMTYDVMTETYYYNTTYTLSGLYTYYIWANDTSNNQNFSATQSFTITSTNQPPYQPSNPDPYDGESNVDGDHDLSWTGGDPDPEDTVTYDVYFGDTSPPPQVSWNQTDSTYEPGTMEYETQYFWKIVAWDNHGASSTGPLWSFTTEEEPEIDPDQSFMTLTNENMPFLVTCPHSDGPAYQYVKVTVKNVTGNPIAGIPASDFSFTINPTGYDTHWYGTLSCTFTAMDQQTNANGEIRFTMKGDTSIYGNITIRVTVQTIPLNDIDTLPCKSPDYDTNGAVSLGDFVIFASDYSKVRWRSDFTGDGLVSLGDFVLFAGHYAHHS